MSSEFAQACDFKFATLKWLTPVPGLGPELCHDRGRALPHPWDCVGAHDRTVRLLSSFDPVLSSQPLTAESES